MSWRSGTALFKDMWPAIKSHIPEQEIRVEFTTDLIKLFARWDMMTYDVEDLHPDVRAAIRQAGYKVADPQYKKEEGGSHDT